MIRVYTIKKWLGLFFTFFMSISCVHTQNIEVITKVDKDLKEVSGLQLVSNSNLYWVIEDAGNKPILYGLDENGNKVQEIRITNVKNNDWEDITADKNGILYIGDFGDNSRKRKTYSIYKIVLDNVENSAVKAEVISFSLPKKKKSYDFEAFFIRDNHFYVFSKENGETKIFKVENRVGEQEATYLGELKLKRKHSEITAADIATNDNKIALLTHKSVLLLTNFKNDEFDKSSVKEIMFNHNSQKEGMSFKDNSTLLIADEKSKHKGGKIYYFNLDK
jgi:hypothetical protein